MTASDRLAEERLRVPLHLLENECRDLLGVYFFPKME